MTRTIGLLGDQNLNYPTHRELVAATELFPDDVDVRWIPTDSTDALGDAAEVNALWAIPGTPYRNDDVVYEAIRHARTSGQPFLGTCGGFQYAVVEFARNVAALSEAGHAESEPDAAVHVVHALSCSLVGEEREVTVQAGTKLGEVLGTAPFTGFHYCSYGLAEEYADQLEQHGLTISAHAPDAGAEAVELPDHPFFIATLFQPQVGSLAGQPLSPLIEGFIAAAR